MATMHNHPPDCCCLNDRTRTFDRPCPACPMHGDLAQLHQAAARMADNPPEDN